MEEGTKIFLEAYYDNNDYDESLAEAAEAISVKYKVSVAKAYSDLENVVPSSNMLESLDENVEVSESNYPDNVDFAAMDRSQSSDNTDTSEMEDAINDEIEATLETYLKTDKADEYFDEQHYDWPDGYEALVEAITNDVFGIIKLNFSDFYERDLLNWDDVVSVVKSSLLSWGVTPQSNIHPHNGI